MATTGRPLRKESSVRWWAVLVLLLRLLFHIPWFFFKAVKFLSIKKTVFYTLWTLVVPIVVFILMSLLVNRQHRPRGKLLEQMALGALPHTVMVCCVLWLLLAYATFLGIVISTGFANTRAIPTTQLNTYNASTVEGSRVYSNLTNSGIFNGTSIQSNNDSTMLYEAGVQWLFEHSTIKDVKKGFHRIYTNISVDLIHAMSQSLPKESLKSEAFARQFSANLYNGFGKAITQYIVNRTEETSREMGMNMNTTDSGRGKRIARDSLSSFALALLDSGFVVIYLPFYILLHSYFYLVSRRTDIIDPISVKDICISVVCVLLGYYMIGSSPSSYPTAALFDLIRILIRGSWLGCIVAENRLAEGHRKSPFGALIKFCIVVSLLESTSMHFLVTIGIYGALCWYIRGLYESLRRRERAPRISMHVD